MVQARYAISAYKAARRTVPPLQAVVLLYDGAMGRIAKAADAARRRDYETQFNEARSAAEIFNGLDLCLDMAKGGGVALSLRDMYRSVCHALMKSVGRTSGAECCDRLVAAIRLTRDAWAEIAGSPRVQPLPDGTDKAAANRTAH
jgi:flagellar protein FliS